MTEADLGHLRSDLLSARLDAARLRAALSGQSDPLPAFVPPADTPTDLVEMHHRVSGGAFTAGEYGFAGLIDALIAFPKPLVCAVNGVGVGIGTTILGFADLVFMSSAARLRCPFTSLGLAPEAASSYLLPGLVGRQNAAWLLMSSEWIDAEEARAMGLVWKVCAPDDLQAEAMRHARLLASRPLPSLIAVKRALAAPHVAAARAATVSKAAGTLPA